MKVSSNKKLNSKIYTRMRSGQPIGFHDTGARTILVPQIGNPQELLNFSNFIFKPEYSGRDGTIKRIIDNTIKRTEFLAARFMKNGIKARAFIVEDFGIDLEGLKVHLETQFRDGMTWNNYGTIWNLDHKKPISKAANGEEMIASNHYTNFQPLLMKENAEKADK